MGGGGGTGGGKYLDFCRSCVNIDVSTRAEAFWDLAAAVPTIKL